MSAFSNWLETQIVNVYLRNGTLTQSANVYLALFTADPGEGDASGAPVTPGLEVVYPSYARQLVTWDGIDANGLTKNTTTVSFPANDSGADITITHAAVFNALTTGNMLIYGALATPKTLANGDVLSFASQALKLTVN